MPATLVVFCEGKLFNGILNRIYFLAFRVSAGRGKTNESENIIPEGKLMVRNYRHSQTTLNHRLVGIINCRWMDFHVQASPENGVKWMRHTQIFRVLTGTICLYTNWLCLVFLWYPRGWYWMRPWGTVAHNLPLLRALSQEEKSRRKAATRHPPSVLHDNISLIYIHNRNLCPSIYNGFTRGTTSLPLALSFARAPKTSNRVGNIRYLSRWLCDFSLLIVILAILMIISPSHPKVFENLSLSIKRKKFSPPTFAESTTLEMASKGMVYAVFRKHRSEKLFIEVFFIDLKRFYAFAFRWFFAVLSRAACAINKLPKLNENSAFFHSER